MNLFSSAKSSSIGMKCRERVPCMVHQECRLRPRGTSVAALWLASLPFPCDTLSARLRTLLVLTYMRRLLVLAVVLHLVKSSISPPHSTCSGFSLPVSARIIMCFFEQTRWACGFWRWGAFRGQCTKEYRTGETCGLKLVDTTHYEPTICNLCKQIIKKNGRIEKLEAHIERWKREGNRRATIEKAESDIAELTISISNLRSKHRDGELDKQRRRKRGAPNSVAGAQGSI
ncbi:hypothetical protein GE09DRAFT_663219 [Coniochaeta sp. 2T2.1]|nr:hypothetical protein GE09DRAFT_662214 [Coniochaeta sp. 2T2.1]KAB5572286.1 hypothetical protein GE09DRAFT_663219 [Coniochaeta sp. 2T2.1]